MQEGIKTPRIRIIFCRLPVVELINNVLSFASTCNNPLKQYNLNHDNNMDHSRHADYLRLKLSFSVVS